MTLAQALELAVQHHQAGRLAEAETIYRQILAVEPEHGGALHLLGLIAQRAGRADQALELIARASVRLPGDPVIQANLGAAYRQLGRLEEAIACYRRALELQPAHPTAHGNLGNALLEMGRVDEAIAAYRRAVELQPESGAAHFRLGGALQERGRIDEAIAAYRRALELQPGDAAKHYHLGTLLLEHGRFDEAVESLREALRWQEEFPEAHNNLGSARKAQGLLDEAIAAYRRALAIRPDYAAAHNNLGNALTQQGRIEEAMVAYRRALELQPDSAESLGNLGNALVFYGRFDEASAFLRRAILLQPGHADHHTGLGAALTETGRLDEAMTAFRRAFELKPDAVESHCNVIYVAQFHHGDDWRALGREKERWRQLHEIPLAPLILPHRNDPQPARRLKVGYVSPDFCFHVVGRNLRPLLAHHSREEVEIFCYSGVYQADAMTAQFERFASHWRSSVGVSDEDLAAMIRADEIDILVDLSLHMEGNRLTLFARKPAPVQASFAGYPGDTGLAAIEYRISDRHLEGGRSAAAEGGQACLIDSFWCYDSLGLNVAVNPSPALSAGWVTFGCLNNFRKVTEPILALWARVLGRVQDSRLVILSPEGSHRAEILEGFARRGVEPGRIEFVPRCSQGDFLLYHHRLDVILDTFPYNGHTTSLEALWMGVPVVSLAGEAPVSRAGLSQLRNLGLPELVAASEAEYLEIAEALACDLPRLIALRASLRERMEGSVLMDAPRFARNVEAAYRQMWRAWCAQQPASPAP